MFSNNLFHALATAVSLLAVAGCAEIGTDRAPGRLAVAAQSSPELTRPALQKAFGSKKPGSQTAAFYENRNFAPAWTGGAEREEMAAQLRAILARAHEQGLRDADYRLPPNAQPAPGPQAAEYDIALTDTALRYAHDLRIGRLRPNDVYDDVELPAFRFNGAAGLAQALTSHMLAEFFADRLPPHPEYRQLAKALIRYRAIADEGGWPSLPGTNEIAFEGKDPRLSALIKRLSVEDSVFAAKPNPSKAELHDAVKRFQARNGLDQDGRVRGETLAALNVSAKARADQIAANMERWRWLPLQFESRYVAVNVPDQSVQFVRDGKAILTSRVIVGRKTSPTPITRSEIVAVVVNPPWDIPGDIAARDLLPHLRQNANYLATKRMVVTDGPPGDPYGRTIDWRKIVPAEFPYAIRQLPGPQTALGTVMLDSPNDFDVYLHDTPGKKFFASSEREISNGCVRVQQILPLASLMLKDNADRGMAVLKQASKSSQTQRLTLDKPLPVYFLYWTVMANSDGSIEFRPDRYHRDPALIAALAGKTVRAKSAQADAMPEGEVSP